MIMFVHKHSFDNDLCKRSSKHDLNKDEHLFLHIKINGVSHKNIYDIEILKRVFNKSLFRAASI